jgi:hypothetical protein
VVFLGAAHLVRLIRASGRRSLRGRIASGLFAGALIQEDLAWLRDFFLESSGDGAANRVVLPAGDS